MNKDDLGREVERIAPSDIVSAMMYDRPYDGQPHTDTGERGKQQIEGLTMRDIRDCFVLACFESSGLTPEQWPGTVYGLPWNNMDPIAISQNLTCNIEKRMGIYPNIPLGAADV